MFDRTQSRDTASASLTARPTVAEAAEAVGEFTFVHRNAAGEVLDTWTAKNLVVNTGLNLIAAGGLTSPAKFVGLTGATPTIAAADTLASKAWTEFTTYSQGTRPSWVGVTSGAAATNSASVAVFTISTGGTVGGAFLATDSTKGGTTGTLFSAVAFTGGNRLVAASDSLEVTYNVSITAT